MTVELEKQGDVTVVTLVCPDVRNAVDGVTAQALHQLINGLDIPQPDKDRLLAMTPASYIGKAAELARRV